VNGWGLCPLGCGPQSGAVQDAGSDYPGRVRLARHLFALAPELGPCIGGGQFCPPLDLPPPTPEQVTAQAEAAGDGLFPELAP
jgi:hypothetical protein